MVVSDAERRLRLISSHIMQADLMLLVISGDPKYINWALVSDTRVEFIEKPFAWCELRQKLQQILHTRALSCRNSETALAA